jgi:hypothetical protein
MHKYVLKSEILGRAATLPDPKGAPPLVVTNLQEAVEAPNI